MNVQVRPSKYTISGTVTDSMQEGVSMQLYENSCGSSTLIDSVLTAVDGSYIFNDLLEGDYTVTPLKTGDTFFPLDQLIIISDDDATDVDFTSN